MRFQLLTLLAALTPYTLADVKFSVPAPGAQVPAGQVTVSWVDSGVAPALTGLTTYTLTLMVGGNTDADSLPLTAIATAGQFAAGNTATGNVAAGIAGPTPNGFYWKMVSVASGGGQVINYSNRFTMIGMTGVTPPANVQAVTALGGTTAGPATVNQVSNGDTPAAGAAPAAGAGVYTVPYQLQTGLTKYAPMQPMPPTKITKSNYTPLYPTSAYTVAKTWLPVASIVTTITASQTFTASSKENQATPASHPNANMQKYLNRWKD